MREASGCLQRRSIPIAQRQRGMASDFGRSPGTSLGRVHPHRPSTTPVARVVRNRQSGSSFGALRHDGEALEVQAAGSPHAGASVRGRLRGVSAPRKPLCCGPPAWLSLRGKSRMVCLRAALWRSCVALTRQRPGRAASVGSDLRVGSRRHLLTTPRCYGHAHGQRRLDTASGQRRTGRALVAPHWRGSLGSPTDWPTAGCVVSERPSGPADSTTPRLCRFGEAFGPRRLGNAAAASLRRGPSGFP